ncbi:hypothetical protein BOX15_Mlig014090g1 [Macrostomum lignano]|uniref:Uncharacterized protein n=1 Tax=Macrostomum lignano TaxID=282301 RepID=A0A267DM71_9PLAT|nr:hypothetical protein BOX15_Mlig014090g1 [Macrostomum lignano]
MASFGGAGAFATSTRAGCSLDNVGRSLSNFAATDYASLPRLRRPTREPARLPQQQRRPADDGSGDPLWTTMSFPMPHVGTSGIGCSAGCGFGAMALSGHWDRHGRVERDLYPLLEETPPQPPQPPQPPPAEAAAEKSNPASAASSAHEVELSDVSSASLSSVLEIDAAGMLRDEFAAAAVNADTDLDDSCCEEDGDCCNSSSGATAVAATAAQPPPPTQPRPASSSIPVRPGSISQLPRLARPAAWASGNSSRLGTVRSGYSTLQPLRRRRDLQQRQQQQQQSGGVPLEVNSLPRRPQRRCSDAAAAAAVDDHRMSPQQQQLGTATPPGQTRLPVPWSAPPRSAPAKAKPLGVVAPTIIRPPAPPSAPLPPQSQQSLAQTLPHCRLSSLSKDSGYADSMLSSSASQTPIGSDEKPGAAVAPAPIRVAAPNLARRSSSGIPVAAEPHDRV